MTKPVLILDVDNVLLDHVPAFLDWIDRKHGIVGKMKEKPTSSYDFTFEPHLSSAEMQPYITQFNRSQLFGRLNTIAGAVDGVKNLKETGLFSRISAVSSCGNHPHTLEYRARQLGYMFWDIEEIICLPQGADKLAMYRHFPAGSVVIDDAPSHMLEASEVGHHPILFDRPFNKHAAWPVRLTDWSNAVYVVNQLLTSKEKEAA